MFASLFAHLAWADEAAHAALESMPRDTAETGHALAIYAHLAASEHIWLARLEGRTPRHAVWPALDLRDAARLAAQSVAALAAFAERVDAGEAEREIVYRNSAGREFRTRVEDVLAHVALHGSYHRGQLALLARQAGATPAVTDYIAFVRAAGALPRA